MNRYIYFLVFLIILSGSCTKKPHIIIEGSLSNGARKMLYLDRLNISQTVTIDSLKVRNNNTFRFKVITEQPDIYILRNAEGEILNLLPLPGETVIVEADYLNMDKSYGIKGSEESELIRQLVDNLSETREKLNSLNDDYSRIVSPSADQTASFLSRQRAIIKDQRDFSIRFIIQHLKSFSSIYALYQKLNPEQLVLGENRDIQYMKIVADSLSRYYPEVPLVKSFVNDARSVERRYYTMMGIQKKLNEINTNLPDIELPDPEGNILKLSSLRGKTVLLYFWSPLSDSCKKQNRNLYQTYTTYKNRGFEIYAIGFTDNQTAWANTIILDRLNWKNVIEQNTMNSPLIWAYNLSGLPTSFLINDEGEILARNLFGNDLRIWLDNLLR